MSTTDSFHTVLRLDGHDVLELQQSDRYEGLSDAHVLELAVHEGRVLVTCNAKQFVSLLVASAEAQRAHHGCNLLWRFEHRRHGTILRSVRDLLARYPDASDWIDRAASG